MNIFVGEINMPFFLEILGTIAFAATGAAKAVDKRLDIFGVIFIAVLSSVGGGIVRDIIIGNTPPNTFKNPIYILVATLSGMAVMFFIKQYNKKLYWKLLMFWMQLDFLCLLSQE